MVRAAAYGFRRAGGQNSDTNTIASARQSIVTIRFTLKLAQLFREDEELGGKAAGMGLSRDDCISRKGGVSPGEGHTWWKWPGQVWLGFAVQPSNLLMREARRTVPTFITGHPFWRRVRLGDPV